MSITAKTKNELKAITLRQLIAGFNGTFFSVTFIKKNGEVRTMQCRTGVKKYVKNTKSTATATAQRKSTLKANGMLGVYDMQNGYRTINLNTVTEIKHNGTIEFKN